jgi:hypothetical protein
VPLAAGIIAGIGGVNLKFTDNFSIGGIALGTIVALVAYHGVRWLAPAHLREQPGGGALIVAGEEGAQTSGRMDE